MVWFNPLWYVTEWKSRVFTLKRIYCKSLPGITTQQLYFIDLIKLILKMRRSGVRLDVLLLISEKKLECFHNFRPWINPFLSKSEAKFEVQMLEMEIVFLFGISWMKTVVGSFWERGAPIYEQTGDISRAIYRELYQQIISKPYQY